MKILRWMAVTFSLYSRIPMPRFTWEEDDMAHSLMFFPLVGAVIGAIIWVINVPSFMAEIPLAVKVMLTILAPIIVTGGFHLDGFMDTEDALRSYADKDKKLEILKDPHIGAFAVIGLVRALIIEACAVTFYLFTVKGDSYRIILLGLIFVVSRCLSGLTSLTFKKAKKSGMLYEETKNDYTGVKTMLVIFLVASVIGAVIINQAAGLTLILANLFFMYLYRFKAYKEFGGVTGDTAGWFLCSSEGLVTAVVGVVLFTVG